MTARRKAGGGGAAARWGSLLAAAVAAAGAGVAAADIVRLKNGNTVEGTIRTENDREVVVDFGVGSTRIPRSRIASVEKAAGAAPSVEASEWQAKYFAHPNLAPVEHRDLASAYRQVVGLREAAVAARRAVETAGAREAALRSEVEILLKKQVALSARLRAESRGVRSQEEVLAYNALVADNQALGAKMMLKQGEIAKLKTEVEDAQRAVTAFTVALERFDQAVSGFARGATATNAAAGDEFLRRLSQELGHMKSTIRAYPVASERGGHGIVVAVAINGRDAGRFVVDTGASVVALSEEAARRVGLDLSRGATQEMGLADGRKVMATPVTLASVSVGAARAADVAAAVLPAPPAPGTDGLLGMSFLREFVMSVDAASGQVTLRRFEP